ncbi:MAG: hypothetical protein KF855_17800 [Acidobacteria bacterium]|nr:hypothetical protein [Acidobacteriota bacterium]
MWKQLFDFIREALVLQRETQQNKTDIKDARDEVRTLRHQVENLTLLTQQLMFDIQRIDEREQSERREIALKLENELLKLERRLPRDKK